MVKTGGKDTNVDNNRKCIDNYMNHKLNLYIRLTTHQKKININIKIY